MKTIELKVARIGNSRGVRLPAASLLRYRIGDRVIMEERSDGLLLRPPGPATAKLSWAETALETARAVESWGDWDPVSSDGLESIPWEKKRQKAAESRSSYHVRKHGRSPREAV